MNPLNIDSVDMKIKKMEAACHEVLEGSPFKVPLIPARDLNVVPVKELPVKPGLAKREGQARLLHDLANIELQAMELGLRTLIEYPEADKLFREQLVDIVLDEARHLKMCLQEIRSLGFEWGSWPVHMALWQAVSAEDTLLDRIVIVHRYLEGSGLDAGERLLRRLSGVDSAGASHIVKVISEEELGHVQFGSYWYRKICQQEGLEAAEDFYPRLKKLQRNLPRRMENIDREVRLRAGFTIREVDELKSLQLDF